MKLRATRKQFSFANRRRETFWVAPSVEAIGFKNYSDSATTSRTCQRTHTAAPATASQIANSTGLSITTTPRTYKIPKLLPSLPKGKRCGVGSFSFSCSNACTVQFDCRVRVRCGRALRSRMSSPPVAATVVSACSLAGVGWDPRGGTAFARCRLTRPLCM